jgi:hypothetical protein
MAKLVFKLVVFGVDFYLVCFFCFYYVMCNDLVNEICLSIFIQKVNA